MRIWILMLGFNGLNIGAFTRHPSKSPVFLKSIRHREPSISQIWCNRRLSKKRAPYNITFLCFSFLFSEEKFNKIDDEFTKCNTFLVSCLGNIVKRGAFPHCKSFLWRVKNFSSTNLSPSSLDMLESLVLQRSFEPLFTEGMFLSSLCLLFGLKKDARRSASNVTTLAFVVSTLFVVLAFQWKTRENTEALFKMGCGGGVGVKVFLFNSITFRSIPNLFEPKGRTRQCRNGEKNWKVTNALLRYQTNKPSVSIRRYTLER